MSTTDLNRVELLLAKPDATRADIESLCADARQLSLYGVCVSTSALAPVYAALDESPQKIIALVGFPLGHGDSDVKRYETEVAADLGAHEIEAVVNAGHLKDGDPKRILREMRDIIEAADERPVRFAFETHLLTRDEIILGCELARDAGAQAVCAGTGFQNFLPKIEDIKTLREIAGTKLAVKVAGGNEPALFKQLVEAGAERIGLSYDSALIAALAK